MNSLINAKRKLLSLVSQTEELRHLEFPYVDSKQAIELLYKKYVNTLEILSAPQNADTREETTTIVNDLNQELTEAHPILGFLLRSTNVRNSFEIIRPLSRLAGEILEPSVPINERKTRVILSSEWDYSPTFDDYDSILPDFIFIGLPA